MLASLRRARIVPCKLAAQLRATSRMPVRLDGPSSVVRWSHYASLSMAANTCSCPPGSAKFLQSSYATAGKKSALPDGLEFYESGTAGNKAVILIPDVWGWDSGRVRAVADLLAENGYYALVPKLLIPNLEGGTDGDGLPPSFDFGTRGAEFGPYIKQITWAALKPKIGSLLQHLESVHTPSTGLFGFCWGGWALFHACADFPGKFAAGVIFHPSVHLEDFVYGGSSKALAERVHTPVLLMPVSADPDMYRPGGHVIEALKANNAASETTTDFAAQQHGFSIRGDISNPDTKAAVEGALQKALEYCAKHL
eukprot:m.236847 g.236847  ORF g.236847 m.236847 type:complete len:310 (+) comp13044_c0_seq1:69-998(+)